jgi:hypothetical protein
VLNFKLRIQINIMINRILIVKVFIICTFCVFYSCNKPASKDAKTDKDSTFSISDTLRVESENPQITAYRTYINSLDSTKAESATLALSEFKRAFAGKSTGLCDSAYLELQELIDTVELKLNDRLEDDTTDYSAFYMSAKIPKNLELGQKALQKDGFKFATSEGTVYIEQDRTFVTKNLLTFFSQPMQTYLLQIEKENREGFMEDAGIVISPRLHVDRIIWYEKFIAENPDFLMIKNCKTYKKAYLTYLMTGIDNTYLYDFDEDMKLTPYFVQAYAYLLKTYPDSEAATLILPYKQAIEQKQKSVVQELLKKYIIKGLIYSQGI